MGRFAASMGPGGPVQTGVAGGWAVAVGWRGWVGSQSRRFAPAAPRGWSAGHFWLGKSG